MHDWKKRRERKEGWMRIIVLIVSGIVLEVWKALIVILAIINWFVVIFTAKRNKGMAEFCEIWNTQYYRYMRYMTCISNKRPFPFSSLGDKISVFER
jgi:hypothetical protein